MKPPELEAEAIQKQRNTLPQDTIRNAAGVDGFIIRGDKPFTTVQRVGAVILGVLYCSPGIGGIVATIVFIPEAIASRHRVELLILPLLLLISAGWLYIGVRAVRNGLRRPNPHPHKHSRRS